MTYSEINVLFFVESLEDRIGGMEVHAQYFQEYFRNDQTVQICGIVTKRQGQDVLNFNNKQIPMQLRELATVINPDLLFFNSGHWIEDLVELREVFPNKAFVYRTGGNEILKAPLIRKVESNHLARQALWTEVINKTIDLIISNSQFTEKRLRHQGITVPCERVVGGVNAVNLQQRIPSEITTLFCAARFVPYKNHSKLIMLISELKTRGLHFKLLLAGEGPLSNEIENLIEKLKLTDTISLLGPLSNQAVCEVHCHSDIYLQLSDDKLTQVEGGEYIHTEGMGRSILEAITAGTFVIAGKAGALPEIINSSNGVLLEASDINTMANIIEPIIKNPPQAGAHRTEYDWQNVFKSYTEFFKKLVAHVLTYH